MSNSIVANRSALKEFLASIAVISGDLSNITAPPFVLAENSTTELPQYWADHPSLFIAPAKGQSEEERALLVLKWFLGSLKNQQHAGRKPEDGIKKPLNAFLGELFIGKWDSEAIGETRLVSEQVSHHPPVTACYLSNEKFGVRAEGFTCQEITFSGGVNIKQKGYAVLHLDQHAEDYLIPVPNVKVKGILSGTPYPELTGTYSIISSTRYVSEVKFEGKGMIFGGTKNSFHARVFHVDRPSEDIFQVDGQWSDTFTIQDAQPGEDMEVVNVAETESIPISVLPIAKQDPWESRRAWGDVIGALERGDMKGVSNSKSIVEEGQRRMRKDEQEKGVGEFQRVFFQRVETDPVFEKLSEIDPGSFTIDKAGGSWKANEDAIRNAKTPYHGELIPT
ncbi:Oxysterol-binding protein, partial [Amniculicola lignicola CBS 123094]